MAGEPAKTGLIPILLVSATDRPGSVTQATPGSENEARPESAIRIALSLSGGSGECVVLRQAQDVRRTLWARCPQWEELERGRSPSRIRAFTTKNRKANTTPIHKTHGAAITLSKSYLAQAKNALRNADNLTLELLEKHDAVKPECDRYRITVELFRRWVCNSNPQSQPQSPRISIPSGIAS